MPASSLLTAEFTCEVVTPMFLAGAEQKPDGDQPGAELRVASFRGALRWWLRALLAGQGHARRTDLSDLCQHEETVFGSTKVGSVVRIRLRADALVVQPPDQLPNFQQGQPTRYLWYSTDFQQNKRCWLDPETPPFRLIFSTLPDQAGSTAKRDALAQAVKALWLLAWCGGVGTRSRRAAGSFCVKPSVGAALPGGVALPEFGYSGSPEPDDFAAWFRAQAAKLGLATPVPLGPFPVPTLAPNGCRIALVLNTNGHPFSSWQQAVAYAGSQMKSFRLKYGNGANGPANGDYYQMREYMNNGTGPTDVERVRFGLPLAFRFRHDNTAHTPFRPPAGTATVNPAGFKRRASPLWISVSELADTRFALVLTHFDSEFLAGTGALHVSHRVTHGDSERETQQGRTPATAQQGQKTFTPPVSTLPSIVDRFINSLSPTPLYP